MSEYHAFSERIGQEVALRPLTDDHIQELVSSYLDLARTNGTGGIEPFEKECLKLVHQQSQGNVRQALSLCSRVIDAAVDEEERQVKSEFVQEVLAR
jgi:type II secretory pathway predicted ATPase ExeA